MAINRDNLRDIVLEGSRIMFRNFSGAPSQFNPQGNRSFCVALEPSQADALREQGWNVRTLQPRDPQEDPQDYIQVAVRYTYRPPHVYTIVNGVKNELSEETISMLDHAYIEKSDMVLSPYVWEMNGRVGIKAYLKVLYCMLEDPDVLAYKYAMDEGPGEDDMPF